MAESRHILYFMGSLNGDITLFRDVWKFIKEYLDEGPATLFCAGNFGLSNQKFLDQVEEEISGFTQLHIAGGNEAKEGWLKNPPPKDRYVHIRPNIVLHSFGSCIRIKNFAILFAGLGTALPLDFLPDMQQPAFSPCPSKEKMQTIVETIQKHRPDIVISHVFPRGAAEYLTKKLEKDDLRKSRLEDPLIPFLSKIENTCLEQKKKIWWFGGGLNVMGSCVQKSRIKYVSLCSFIMVKASLASLEIVTQSLQSQKRTSLGNLVYV